MLKRDRRRWAAADADGDDNLTKEEFAAFLHPEDSEHMRGIVVQETMEDIDKDGDGKVSDSYFHLLVQLDNFTQITYCSFIGFLGRIRRRHVQRRGRRRRTRLGKERKRTIQHLPR